MLAVLACFAFCWIVIICSVSNCYDLVQQYFFLSCDIQNIHNYQECDLLYRYQVSCKNAKKGKSYQSGIALTNNKSPMKKFFRKFKLDCFPAEYRLPYI